MDSSVESIISPHHTSISREKFNQGAVFLIDKPLEWTSFDVIKKLKFSLKIKKVGHAGTLDPLATGLLILCTGKKTKDIQHYQAQEKEYEGTIVIGKTTPSYDLETPFDSETPYHHINEEEVRSLTEQFIGELEQLPPTYSAIKVKGERLYKKARQGKAVDVPTRKVIVSDFEITQLALPTIHFQIRCSKGTYIRSIAHDFGKALGVGGYLGSLRRTKIGSFKVEDAWKIEDITSVEVKDS